MLYLSANNKILKNQTEYIYLALIQNYIGESCQDAAVIEFQLSTSTVSRGAPYLIYHVE